MTRVSHRPFSRGGAQRVRNTMVRRRAVLVRTDLARCRVRAPTSRIENAGGVAVSPNVAMWHFLMHDWHSCQTGGRQDEGSQRFPLVR